MPSLKGNQQGYILIFAMVFVAILLTLSTTLIGATTVHNKAESQTVASHQALQLAEAGINKAIYELNQNPNYSGETGTSLGAGKITISIMSIDPNTKRITSAGYIPNSANPVAEKTVKATASVDLSTISFQFGVQVGVGGLIMGNGSKVNGNIFSNGNISGSGVISGDASVAAGTAAVADQQWTTTTAGFLFGNVSSKKDAAQSFVPSATTTLTLNKVSLYLKKVGSPGDLSLFLVKDDHDQPAKTVLASGAINASLITGNYAFIDGTFITLPTLTSGEKYWIILSAPTISSNNYFTWGIDSADAYASGTGKYSNNWDTGNPKWTSAGGDLNFKTYLGGVPTSLTGVTVGGDARATILDSCTVGRNAYFQTASTTCAVTGSKFPATEPPAPQSMPISDAQITAWENTAQSGSVIPNNYTIDGTDKLGPAKIDGDLTVNGTLYLTGPVWVNGNINLSENSIVRVDVSLGNSGTVLMADYRSNPTVKGIVNSDNNVTIAGNGQVNSYPLILSTYSGGDAIVNLSNNVVGAIFYAGSGGIDVRNNATANQLTGYSIHLKNNAIVNYASGLQNALFSNGPGGSWIYKAGTFTIVK